MRELPHDASGDYARLMGQHGWTKVSDSNGPWDPCAACQRRIAENQPEYPVCTCMGLVKDPSYRLGDHEQPEPHVDSTARSVRAWIAWRLGVDESDVEVPAPQMGMVLVKVYREQSADAMSAATDGLKQLLPSCSQIIITWHPPRSRGHVRAKGTDSTASMIGERDASGDVPIIVSLTGTAPIRAEEYARSVLQAYRNNTHSEPRDTIGLVRVGDAYQLASGRFEVAAFQHKYETWRAIGVLVPPSGPAREALYRASALTPLERTVAGWGPNVHGDPHPLLPLINLLATIGRIAVRVEQEERRREITRMLDADRAPFARARRAAVLAAVERDPGMDVGSVRYLLAGCHAYEAARGSWREWRAMPTSARDAALRAARHAAPLPPDAVSWAVAVYERERSR
jgi:hypothetical protein